MRAAEELLAPPLGSPQLNRLPRVGEPEQLVRRERFGALLAPVEEQGWEASSAYPLLADQKFGRGYHGLDSPRVGPSTGLERWGSGSPNMASPSLNEKCEARCVACGGPLHNAHVSRALNADRLQPLRPVAGCASPGASGGVTPLLW